MTGSRKASMARSPRASKMHGHAARNRRPRRRRSRLSWSLRPGRAARGAKAAASCRARRAGLEQGRAAALAALDAALSRLSAAGVTLVRRRRAPRSKPPKSRSPARCRSRSSSTLSNRAGRSNLIARAIRSKLTPFARDRLVEAERITLDQYRARRAERAAIRTIYASLAGEVDAVITSRRPARADRAREHRRFDLRRLRLMSRCARDLAAAAERRGSAARGCSSWASSIAIPS